MSEVRNLFNTGKTRKKAKELNYLNFDAIKIGIASPAKIRAWSFGEVKKPETINYRTLKPERDGLLCERIFGPSKDYECACGKYRWVKFKGVVCDRCGVEVTEAKVRRERMGHIELACPVAHIWFLRKSPSRIGIILDMRPTDLEKVVYYAAYVVLEDTKDPVTGRIEYKRGEVFTETQLSEVKKKYSRIKVGIGANAIRELLENIDIKVEMARIGKEILAIKNDADRAKAIKRMKIMEGFLASGNHPEWMIMTVLPVLPPDLRPLVPLEGGRFATSDLNDLYRRIINRNNRLKHIEALRAPQVMIYNEKRLLQEAVDALIENGARGKVVLGAANRPLKSISDILKGKQGRFRQNLLGKRVDYSGRSVIVVGPNLKLNQCGLPKEMALELFKPFVLAELIKKENITLKVAKKKLEHADNEIWDILERVTRKHPVMLNRAPTLHRLGIQAFEPVLIEGLAIQLHPLTCAAFNADFDGDQMAVHVPISQEAQMEARMLMMATNNILSPASGRPMANPSHDMVLGINYLTKVKDGERGEGKFFNDKDEAQTAHQHGVIDLHAKIKVRGTNDTTQASPDFDPETKAWKKPVDWKDYITVGRLIFLDILPENVDRKRYNKAIGKKDLSNLVDECYKNPEVGHHATVTLLDSMMNLGFHFCTLSGITISIADMSVPEKKADLILSAQKQVRAIGGQAKDGVITENERYNKIIDVWTHVSDNVADMMFKEMQKRENQKYDHKEPRFNAIFMMADSGARGSRQQVKQLAGMRGLMAKPQKKLTGGVGEIIENPILSNFREGLTVLEYFISTHGGRKGLSDTALKTADAGYLTRRLVDVGHNVVITSPDCGTENGVEMMALVSGDEVIEPLIDRITGRTALEDVKYNDAEGKTKTIVKAGELISPQAAREMDKAKIESVPVRSVLTCEANIGICAKCYGQNLATGYIVEPGEAVGIIAAQSIGEPGTQLTLRTFHIGGTASRVLEKSEAKAKAEGKLSFKDVRTVKNREGHDIVVSRGAIITVKYADAKKFPIDELKLSYGARIHLGDKASVKAGVLIAEWDPHTVPIITEYDGKARYLDIKEGVTLHEERNKVTGLIERKIIEHRGAKRNPRLVVESGSRMAGTYTLPTDTIIIVEQGEEVKKGDTIAKIHRDTSKTKDITGGLPRVAELFEVRRPKNAAIITKIEGLVSMGTTPKGLVEVSVKNEETGQVEAYPIPYGKHLVVYEGDRVAVGEALTEGSVDMHDLLAVKGIKEVQNYIVDAIQEVYRLQGVNINDKYIEIVVRQMLSNVKVTEPGDTTLLKGEIVNKTAFRAENEHTSKTGHEPAQGEPVLLGISKASLASESFISAASFQETTRVLTDAATTSKVDYLKGLKENVIIGHLVPAGSGFATRKLAEEALEEAK
ncbi:MAG: DNA-directed RNA polymerase subunit beta' [Elusimicrobia bacterium CG08_land_8_20_14_0_20_59_10]|nr:MAG: DNA-directed RNA polymerase subunit beta' [Elusimicrobia bacterium CG08_land_8_20_14_0_20_59_10]